MLQELMKIAQFYFNVWLFLLIWNDFFLDAATNQKGETFLAEPVSSLKLVYNLKHLSRKQFHKIVKDESIFLGNLRYLQKFLSKIG